MHYVITHGGDLPNIVPTEAEVWYFLRAHTRDELEEVANRVSKIAQGAALMTETAMENVFNGGCSNVLNNHYLAELQTEAMQVIGPIQFTEEEKAYAQKVNDGQPKGTVEAFFNALRLPKEMKDQAEELRGQPLLGKNFPPSDEGDITTGSTDVGDLSWIAPLSMLKTACCATGATGHGWGVVSTGAMSIGHKGMMHAAKSMALAAIDLYADPEHLRKARHEFEKAIKDRPYRTPLPDNVKPPRYENPFRAERI